MLCRRIRVADDWMLVFFYLHICCVVVFHHLVVIYCIYLQFRCATWRFTIDWLWPLWVGCLVNSLVYLQLVRSSGGTNIVPPDFAPVPICQPETLGVGSCACCTAFCLTSVFSLSLFPSTPSSSFYVYEFGVSHAVWGDGLLLLNRTFPLVTSQGPDGVYFYASSWLVS